MFSLFNKYRNLVIALSEKKDGSMKLFGNSFKDKRIVENRRKFLNKLGIDSDLIVNAGLIHGNNIQIVTERDKGSAIPKTDGLLTDKKNLFLAITVADCLPIFFYDKRKEIVGLIHGGWRSLAQNILKSAAIKLIRDFGSSPENILVGIGPGISKCHFEVKKDLLFEFGFLDPVQKIGDRRFFARGLPTDVLLEKNGKLFLDLKKIAKIQLINLGFKEENIEIRPDCTYCLSDKYFSFRRNASSHHNINSKGKSEPPETMMAIIGMKKSCSK